MPTLWFYPGTRQSQCYGRKLKTRVDGEDGVSALYPTAQRCTDGGHRCKSWGSRYPGPDQLGTQASWGAKLSDRGIHPLYSRSSNFCILGFMKEYEA